MSWKFPPHLITAGGQVFSKGLDGADLVMLYELCETVVSLTVSWYHELPTFILGNDKMSTPVMAPLEEMYGQWDKSERQKGKQLNSAWQTWFASLVGQDVANGFITEANEKTSQSFIFQQIFCIPGRE